MLENLRTLRVHKSNRVERLVDALADHLRSPQLDATGRADPFTPERIVIHSRGMESWLSAKLSERIGICANVEFDFPKRLILDAFRDAVGDQIHEGKSWEPDQLAWSILSTLPPLIGRPEFAAIRRYVADDVTFESAKSHRFVRRLADLFDRYVTYREEMVRGWEEGGDDHWQAILWRALRSKITDRHLADLASEFLRQSEGELPLTSLPRRVALFGISMLPPLYVRVLAALSHHIDVDLFVLCPSREYWGDIASEREQLRHRSKIGAADGDEELWLTDGHPILASLGRLGRDFQVTLEVETDYHEPDVDHFEDPLAIGGPESLLRTLQHDILHLRSPANETRRLVESSDRSVEIHACHGPMRQVEVLKDRLLDLFQHHRDLEPRDVVIMTPDIDTYAPLIEAAFLDPRGDARHIPYRIADRSLRRESPIADAFLRALDLVGSRAEATPIFDFLSLPPVRQRFGIEPDDLDRIAEWIRESGIRWGIDAKHRAQHGQPEIATNSWEFGLDRLFLGFATASDDREVFLGTLPFADVEGGEGELIGRFAAFLETLFDLMARLDAKSHPLETWHELGIETIDRLFQIDDENAWERDRVAQLLRDLVDQATAAEFDNPVHLDVITDLMKSRLEQAGGSASFFAGGLTVCAMVPMRTVPFRVVCLLGLDDAAYPRHDQRLDFDLMFASPRVGDRTRRDEDRYLMLEALLSARDHLLITYSGRSIQTNESLPPSVVVSELIDQFSECYEVPPKDDAVPSSVESRIVVEHPLQAFSPRVFANDERHYSYNHELLPGARALTGTRELRPPFMTTELPDDESTEGELEIGIDQLIAFMTQPSKEFLRRRLNVSLFDDIRSFEDREPIELNALEKYHVRASLLELKLDQVGEEASVDLLRARGILPLGNLSIATAAEAQHQVDEFHAELAPLLELTGPPVEVDLPFGQVHLTGTLDSILYRDGEPSGLLYHRFANHKVKYDLTLWIRHLVAAARWPDRSLESFGHYKNKRLRIGPVDTPREYLEQLIAIYRLGMRRPIPFFPETSSAFMKAFEKGQDLDAATDAARSEFEEEPTEFGGGGEGNDAYVRRLYGDSSPWSNSEEMIPPLADEFRFVFVSTTILAPMLAATRELKS